MYSNAILVVDMELRIVNGDRIRQKRGDRSVREVAAASNGAFTHGALCGWESGDYRPKQDNLIPLLNALGCSYEDITEVVELGLEK